MESETIIKVVDNLVGNIHAIGSCHYDKDAYKNLKCLEEVVYHYFHEFMDECENSKSHEKSMKLSGNRAIEFLTDIRDEINDCLSDYEDIE